MDKTYYISSQEDYDKYCGLKAETPEYADMVLVVENQQANWQETIQIFGNDIVYACGDFRITAFDDVTVICTGYGYVNLKENSVSYCSGEVTINAEDTSKAIVCDNCVCFAYGCSYIKAYDNTRVHTSDTSVLEAYGYCKAVASNESIVDGYEMSIINTISKDVSVCAYGYCTVISMSEYNVKLYDDTRIINPNMMISNWLEYHNIPVAEDNTIKLYRQVRRWKKTNNQFFDFEDIFYEIGKETADNVDSAYRHRIRENIITPNTVCLGGYVLSTLLSTNISFDDLNDECAFLELKVNVSDISGFNFITDNISHLIAVHKFTVVREVPKNELLRMVFNEDIDSV